MLHLIIALLLIEDNENRNLIENTTSIYYYVLHNCHEWHVLYYKYTGLKAKFIILISLLFVNDIVNIVAAKSPEYSEGWRFYLKQKHKYFDKHVLNYLLEYIVRCELTQ